MQKTSSQLRDLNAGDKAASADLQGDASEWGGDTPQFPGPELLASKYAGGVLSG